MYKEVTPLSCVWFPNNLKENVKKKIYKGKIKGKKKEQRGS